MGEDSFDFICFALFFKKPETVVNNNPLNAADEWVSVARSCDMVSLKLYLTIAIITYVFLVYLSVTFSQSEPTIYRSLPCSFIEWVIHVRHQAKCCVQPFQNQLEDLLRGLTSCAVIQRMFHSQSQVRLSGNANNNGTLCFLCRYYLWKQEEYSFLVR